MSYFTATERIRAFQNTRESVITSLSSALVQAACNAQSQEVIKTISQGYCPDISPGGVVSVPTSQINDSNLGYIILGPGEKAENLDVRPYFSNLSPATLAEMAEADKVEYTNSADATAKNVSDIFALKQLQPLSAGTIEQYRMKAIKLFPHVTSENPALIHSRSLVLLQIDKPKIDIAASHGTDHDFTTRRIDIIQPQLSFTDRGLLTKHIRVERSAFRLNARELEARGEIEPVNGPVTIEQLFEAETRAIDPAQNLEEGIVNTVRLIDLIDAKHARNEGNLGSNELNDFSQYF